jgi:hypothetical protein
VLSFSLTEEQMRLKERARAFAKDVVEARIPETLTISLGT